MVSKIGSLKLKNRFLLAPMLEPNDIAFRILCKKAGCGLTWTGMTSPLSKKEIFLDDKPALQIFANSKEGIKSFVEKYDEKVSLWDFNLGCPSKLSRKLQHGAFMDKIGVIKEILIEIKKTTRKPVTIKIRKSRNAFELLELTKEYVDAVIIHPRTISQGYSGKPDYEFALKIKKTTSLPVIYSGDVNEKNAKEILKDFDFVMIGRKAIGNPNIFSRLTNRKSEYDFNDYLKIAKKYNLPFRQIKMQAMSFTKSMKNAKKIRRELVRVKNICELETNKYLSLC